MSTITNYTNLQTEVVSWAKNSGLTGDEVGMIQLAEAKLNRKLRVRAMDKVTTSTLSSAADSIAYPSRVIELQSVARLVDTRWEPMAYLSPDELDAVYSSTSGTPTFYTVTDEISFDCPASSDQTIQVRYWQQLDIAGDATNWVLTNATDLYLYGALMHAAGFMREDERLAQWRALFEEGIFELNTSEARSGSNVATLRTELSAGGAYDINTDR